MMYLNVFDSHTTQLSTDIGSAIDPRSDRPSKNIVGKLHEVYKVIGFIGGDSCVLEKRCRIFADPQKIISQQTWMSRLNQRLNEISSLKHNWDGYGSAPPNSTSKLNMWIVMGILHEMDLEPTQMSPSAEEGVGISFVKGDMYGFLECYNDGEILVAYSDGRGNRKTWTVGDSKEEIKESLERLVACLYV